FSYHGGKLFSKIPQELPHQVTVAVGTPLPPTTRAADVRLVIQKLSADCAVERTKQQRPVHRQFVRTAARPPFPACYLDPGGNTPVLNYGRALAASMCFADVLRPLLANDTMVGLWLPPSVGGALANVALALLGKTSVNLNYTSSAASVDSAVRQCNLR